MKLSSQCRQVRKDRLIAVQENGRTFVIENNCGRIVGQVQVDGCLITEGERCDWLFEIDAPTCRVLFVELKGKDVKRAYEQLLTTIQLLKSKYAGCQLEAFIVSSRVPVLGTAEENLKKSLIKLGVRPPVTRNGRLTVNIC